MNKIFQKNRFFTTLITLLIGWVLFRACNEFYEIAWGTGTWLGEFSRTWALLYYAFVVASIFLFVSIILFFWNNRIFIPVMNRLFTIRKQLGGFRWVLWLVVFIAPVCFFQFTVWGIIFQKLYIRILVWIIVVCLLSILSSNDDRIAGWPQFLSTLILTASLFSVSASLLLVNDYPFSQGWSEGNRLWDYSILFGRDRYIYPLEEKIPVYLDLGRQFIGGVSFLIPGLTISMARLWVGLTQIIPYFLLGFALFRIASRNKFSWLLLTLWTFLFLKQGPIHPPLVISAALVALAWQSPLRYAIPLVVGAGYFAQASRLTWIFAPGMWIFMLEIASVSFSDWKAATPTLKRAILLAVLGLFGGIYFSTVLARSEALIQQTFGPAAVSAPITAPTPPPADEVPAVSNPDENSESSYPFIIDYAIKALRDQPFLWYRLLPNSTYGNGILLALLLAVGPLMVVLFFLIRNGIWHINNLQKLSLLLPLIMFLIVGLVASTKIGGGGDLHNMDMFLIGMLFVGAIAWENGAGDWLLNGEVVAGVIKGVIVFALMNSAIWSLLEIRSFDFGEDSTWIKTLIDAPGEKALEDMLPVQEEIDVTLRTIQEEVDTAELQGEVLFMDQRQLLTFGYVTDVFLVPEYEKKRLMDEAMRGELAYFESFYADLASHRFTLIISEPLRNPVKDSSYQFGEENNAWVTWVSSPVLCYYEPIETFKEVNVQLLVPRAEPVDCSDQLP